MTQTEFEHWTKWIDELICRKRQNQPQFLSESEKLKISIEHLSDKSDKDGQK